MTITLKKADYDAIERRAAFELESLGEAPTIEQLRQQGHTETTWLNSAVDWIAAAGRVVTLLVAEAIQSLAVLIIGLLFALLEYDRIFHGSQALGMTPDQAGLTATAFVAANLIMPIYILRGLRGQTTIQVVKPTLRGYITTFWRRLAFKPTVETKDVYYNPALHTAASVITYATIFLAVYEVLGKVIQQYSTPGTPWFVSVVNVLSADLSTFIMVVAGLALSVGGVFFLQSAAHEIGVRTVTDQPARLTDVLEAKRREHEMKVHEIRQRALTEYVQERQAERKAAEVVEVEPPNFQIAAATQPALSANGQH